jgi:2-amino-4-hydroxy-6-hydroxymethyldihydropteridine diphosphokinase
MHQVFTGLGSNIGDRLKNIVDALILINDNQCQIVKLSSIYETEPVGPVVQSHFLNAVAEISTKYSPLELLDLLKSLEKKTGRRRGEKWGPRIIDLDVLAFDQVVFHHPQLDIPHAELTHRRFVLVPFEEIAPHHVIAGIGKTVSQLLRECYDASQVKFYLSSCSIWKKLGRDLM